MDDDTLKDDEIDESALPLDDELKVKKVDPLDDGVETDEEVESVDDLAEEEEVEEPFDDLNLV